MNATPSRTATARSPRRRISLRRSAAARPAPGGPALLIEHLGKRYRERSVVHDVSLSVARGEIFGILGPNGAGKTTTVECAQGLRRPDAGIIRVLGLDPQRDASALHGRVGSQLQAAGLPERLKVREALDLFASLVPGGADAAGSLERWGLAAKRDASFGELSGGERQRLFVALALLGSPEIVFLDELTQGLDPAARRVAWDLIRDTRDRGCTVVLVTHYMDEAEQLCDRLAVIDEGRTVATGTAQELIASSRRGARVHFSTDTPDVSWLHETSGVGAVRRHGRRVEVEGSGALLALVGSALVARGIVPIDLHGEQPTLEEAYVNLTSAAREPR